MAEKLSENEQLAVEWKGIMRDYPFAYDELMKFIEMQKQTYQIMASGPMEVYRDVPTFDGKKDLQLDFEPEKYAYLLQRGVGCDIVRMYVEDFTTSPA